MGREGEEEDGGGRRERNRRTDGIEKENAQ